MINLYKEAKAINKRIAKDFKNYEKQAKIGNNDNRNRGIKTRYEIMSEDEFTQIAKHKEYEQVKKNITTLSEIIDVWNETAAEIGNIPTIGNDKTTARTWFITVRPDESKISFHDFYNICREFCNRKIFEEFKISFEQKGTNKETLGSGFHMHMIAKTAPYLRSKGEVLRNTISTFKCCTAENCIQVDLCKNPDNILKNYLIEYKSDDNHKIETKEWDEIWRKNMCLEHIYSFQLPIKSVLGN